MTRRQRQDIDGSWAHMERLTFTDDEASADRRLNDWTRVGQYRRAAEMELTA